MNSGLANAFPAWTGTPTSDYENVEETCHHKHSNYGHGPRIDYEQSAQRRRCQQKNHSIKAWELRGVTILRSTHLLHRKRGKAPSLSNFLQEVDCGLVLDSKDIAGGQSSSSRVLAVVQLCSQLLPVYARTKGEDVRPVCLSGKCCTFKDDGKIRQSNNADQVKTNIPQETWKSGLRLVRSRFKGEQCSCSPLLRRLLHEFARVCSFADDNGGNITIIT